MENQKAEKLIKKYTAGTCTPEEKLLVEKWYNQFVEEDVDTDHEPDYEFWKQRITKGLPIPRPKRKLWPLAAAAAVIVLVGVGVFFYKHNASSQLEVVNNKIVPGGNVAILTLADGSKISLTDSISGELAKQSGMLITKTANGQLLYKVAKTDAIGNELVYNTVETPNGGQHQVMLPDGSRVWLNAASSLRFPVNFENVKERQVVLTGEAYFEVFKDAKKPFLVECEGQIIEVLGTHFNINSYRDEKVVKTTLLEGSVKVTVKNTHKSLLLKPGQQSVVSGNDTDVLSVDTEDVVAWKDGYFAFSNEPLEDIMRKIGRWYNVNIEFEDETLKNVVLEGTITRYSTISKVLRKLELTREARFKIQGRTIVVAK